MPSQQHLPACLQKMPLLICSDGVANWVIWKVLAACCRTERFSASCPFLSTRHAHHRRSDFPCAAAKPQLAHLCHPETSKLVEGLPILLPEASPWLWKSLNSRELLLCLLCLPVTRQGTLPVGRGQRLSSSLGVSHLHSCTSLCSS